MLTALAIALTYPYQLIVGPAFILALAICLIFLLRLARFRSWIWGILVLLGFGEFIALQTTGFVWGYIVATATLLVGIIGGAGSILRAGLKRHRLVDPFAINQPNLKLKILKKAAYISLSVVVLSSALLISARATNLIAEDYRFQENFPTFYDSPNLTLIGTVQSVKLNYTVNTGYSYHTFPAYITLTVEKIISGNGWWNNMTDLYNDLSREGLLVYYDKSQVPFLRVGQQVEACGYYCPWIEDSIYSEKFVVASSISGSYINLL